MLKTQKQQAKICLSELHLLHDMEGYEPNEVSKCIDYIQENYL